MRAPPPSLMPMSGTPVFSAKSWILTIFSPYTWPSAPPKMVTSWLNTHTGRPWMDPVPVMTPSPNGRRASIPKALVRWREN